MTKLIKAFLFGTVFLIAGKSFGAVYGPDIHSQPTLQAGTTAYPQFLYVGSSVSIPLANIATMTSVSVDRMGVGGPVLQPVGGTSPTNYELNVLGGDVKIAGTDRGTLLLERTSGAPSAGGGSHVKILEGRDWAPADNSGRFQIVNSSDGYIGFTALTSTDQYVAHPESAGQISMLWAGNGPTSGLGNGYNLKNTGLFQVGGTAPMVFEVSGSSIAFFVDQGDYPMELITNGVKRFAWSGAGMVFRVDGTTQTTAFRTASTYTFSGAQTFSSMTVSNVRFISTTTLAGPILDRNLSAGSTFDYLQSGSSNAASGWSHIGLILQSTQSVVATSSAATGVFPVSTNLSVTITPKFANSLIDISYNGALSSASLDDSCRLGISRNGSQLGSGAASSFMTIQSPVSTATIKIPISINFDNFPNSATAQTYTISFGNTAGVMACTHIASGSAILRAREIGQ